jgi:dienelactone hydrolase
MGESYTSQGVPIPVTTQHPPGGGAHPAIVIAYGTDGLSDRFGPAIIDFAKTLTANGYVSLIPEYFERTGTKPGDEVGKALAKSPELVTTWTETLVDALDYAAGLSDVKADRIGLLGFSMGGNLCLRAALAPSRVKVVALVEFFAPFIVPPSYPPLGNVGKLPTLEIHHGKADTTVDPFHTKAFVKALEDAGKRENVDFKVHWYEGEAHGFVDKTAQDLSKKRTAEFFDRHLK